MEEVRIDDILCAIIIDASYDQPGITFFTDPKLSQQLGSMSYRAGKIIRAHTHNATERVVHMTQEALFIRRGRLRVDFYDVRHICRSSRVLSAGDVILLIAGGHGFQVLEDLNMIEVKQGPYAGDQDKIVFEPLLRASEC